MKHTTDYPDIPTKEEAAELMSETSKSDFVQKATDLHAAVKEIIDSHRSEPMNSEQQAYLEGVESAIQVLELLIEKEQPRTSNQRTQG